jgi:hydroxymethylbilane synthase
MKIRIGTRGSALARTQATSVAAALTERGHDCEIVIIRTTGDASMATSFGSIGPQGVFVREIEQALLDERIDVAVHSCKDLPTGSPNALMVVAVPARADAADVLIANADVAYDAAGAIPLRAGATVGTASARRQSWLSALRPDLEAKPVRGNVPTRVGKLRDGYDAILLAAAGLERLSRSLLDEPVAIALDDYAVTRLDPRAFVPAPAQGALALQCRAADQVVVDAVTPLDDPVAHACVAAERHLLARIEGGCELALGAYCEPTEDGFTLVAMLERDGHVYREKAAGKSPDALADQIWERLVST